MNENIKVYLILVCIWLLVSLGPFLFIGEWSGFYWMITNFPLSWGAEKLIGIGKDSILLIAIVTLVNGMCYSGIIMILFRFITHKFKKS